MDLIELQNSINGCIRILIGMNRNEITLNLNIFYFITYRIFFSLKYYGIIKQKVEMKKGQFIFINDNFFFFFKISKLISWSLEISLIFFIHYVKNVSECYFVKKYQT